MRQSSWSLGIGALALVGLIAVGGTTVGGFDGLDAAVSGVVALIASAYLIAGMGIRRQAGRRVAAPVRSATQASRVAGRRVF